MKPTLVQLINRRDRSAKMIKFVEDPGLLQMYEKRFARLNQQIQNYQD